MTRRDELMKHAMWLKDHGYHQDTDIVRLVDILEQTEIHANKKGQESLPAPHPSKD